MGRMPELDFIEFIESKPLTRAEVAEIRELIRKDQEAGTKARAAREKLEAKALVLPSAERTQLAYQLLSSLAAEESNLPECAWAAMAKSQFEQLQSSQTPAPLVKKPRRRTKSSTASRKGT